MLDYLHSLVWLINGNQFIVDNIAKLFRRHRQKRKQSHIVTLKKKNRLFLEKVIEVS